MGQTLFDRAPYPADTLKLLRQAFDEAWSEITRAHDSTRGTEDRRNKLACIILQLAESGVRDVAVLKSVALRLMAHTDRTSPA